MASPDNSKSIEKVDPQEIRKSAAYSRFFKDLEALQQAQDDMDECKNICDRACAIYLKAVVDKRVAIAERDRASQEEEDTDRAHDRACNELDEAMDKRDKRMRIAQKSSDYLDLQVAQENYLNKMTKNIQ